MSDELRTEAAIIALHAGRTIMARFATMWATFGVRQSWASEHILSGVLQKPDARSKRSNVREVPTAEVRTRTLLIVSS